MGSIGGLQKAKEQNCFQWLKMCGLQECIHPALGTLRHTKPKICRFSKKAAFAPNMTSKVTDKIPVFLILGLLTTRDIYLGCEIFAQSLSPFCWCKVPEQTSAQVKRKSGRWRGPRVTGVGDTPHLLSVWQMTLTWTIPEPHEPGWIPLSCTDAIKESVQFLPSETLWLDELKGEFIVQSQENLQAEKIVRT